MRSVYKHLSLLLAVVLCLSLTSCALFSNSKKEEDSSPFSTVPETTPEETTPEGTTPEETTPAVTDPDLSNDPDPDGTKRY